LSAALYPASVMPVGRGHRPGYKVVIEQNQTFQKDRLDKLHLWRFQRLLLRMFRKQ
jgi:hypothetical protein